MKKQKQHKYEEGKRYLKKFEIVETNVVTSPVYTEPVGQRASIAGGT